MTNQPATRFCLLLSLISLRVDFEAHDSSTTHTPFQDARHRAWSVKRRMRHGCARRFSRRTMWPSPQWPRPLCQKALERTILLKPAATCACLRIGFVLMLPWSPFACLTLTQLLVLRRSQGRSWTTGLRLLVAYPLARCNWCQMRTHGTSANRHRRRRRRHPTCQRQLRHAA